MTKAYSALDLQKMPVLGLVPESAATASAPSSPVEGQLWVDTTTHNLKVYLNGGWIQADNQGVATGAGVSDGDKGDITVTGSGTVWTIDNGVVTGAKIADGTITPNDVSAAYVDGAAGNTSLRSLGTGATQACAGNDARLSDQRTPLDGSVTLAKHAANSVNSSHIVDDSIVLADLNSSLSGPAANVFGLRKLIGGTGSQTSALASDTRLNELAPANGQVSFNSQLATFMATPVSATDGANKGYVDSVAQGLDAKPSVKAATTANITLSGAQTIDGIALVAGDRCLVKDQSTGSQNGIYDVASGAWTRSVDMDVGAEFPGAFTFVEQGSTQADTGWVQTSNAPITVGTTGIFWAQFSGAGSFVDGAGLLKTGNVLDVQVDNVSVEVSADMVRVKDSGITNAKIANGTIDMGTKPAAATYLPVANGGTGAPAAAAARVNLLAAGKATIASPALTANTWSANIAHGLGAISTMPHVMVTEAATGEAVIIDWKVVDSSNIQIRAGIAVSAAALNIVVHA